MKTGRREARMETRDAQHPHRIFDERLGDMPQHARLEIAHAAEWINQFAMLVLGNRIDGEIAATQIVFKRDIGAGVEGKALIAAPGLALGTLQRVLFSCLRIDEDIDRKSTRLNSIP